MSISKRIDLPSLLPADLKIIRGLELGVARGDYSLSLLKKYPNLHILLVDRWSDHHDEREYQLVLSRFKKFSDRVTIWRQTFDDALIKATELDLHFDFIYIDGYAHTGQEGGKTLRDWYPRLNPKGGLFAGHDYHEKWRPTMDAVDEFCRSIGRSIGVTASDEFPSWYLRGTESKIGTVRPILTAELQQPPIQ